MPHLLIRGVTPELIITISKPLIEELANVFECPSDHILLECLHTTAIFDGAYVASYPFVEVNWFDRGRPIRDQAAQCIDRHLRSLGIPEMEIAFRTYGEIEALTAENAKLKDELRKARKALQLNLNGSSANMSSKLRDALRE
ncbi:DUF1904 family protein [Cohnella kolymensis]|uniref:DUF1904 family protein n=1 Tax=Cohnella kolymensis TaxID=1590652 RepID=UPI0009E459EA|nr:DUF1904 family protein [Cohnella kolymensis]